MVINVSREAFNASDAPVTPQIALNIIFSGGQHFKSRVTVI